MRYKLKTWEQLQKEGYKESHRYCYIGDKREPELKFSRTVKILLLGTEVDVCNVDQKTGIVSVPANNQEEHSVHFSLFEDQNVLLQKPLKGHTFALPGTDAYFSSAYHYPNHGFKFPCEFKKLNEPNAVKLAFWILKMAKKKTATKARGK